MSRKLKVIPFDITKLDGVGYVVYQEPLEVIPPVSWESSTDTNNIQEQGVLGNPVMFSMPFQERTYTLDWVGSFKEINRVVNYFTKTSHRHFLLGNLSDQNVVTPGMMFNSKGMLASVTDKYKLPGELYQDYLTRHLGEGYNPGSMGIKVANTSNFSHISTEDGAESFVFIPKNIDFTFRLVPVTYLTGNSIKNNLDFSVTHYTLDNFTEPYSTTFRINDSTGVIQIPAISEDRVLGIRLVLPTSVNTATSVRGVLNYIPPIIYKQGTDYTLDDYEDVPSLVRPVDNYIYNRRSPNIAELSMNFKEITHVTE